MGGGQKNFNLVNLKTGESMDQPHVQHDHVMNIIPPAPNASSIVGPSSAPTAEGFQTSNLPSLVPHEDISTDVSTSSNPNVQARSHAPLQQRSHPCRWNTPSFWMKFYFCSTSIHILLLVVFFSVFRDEHPHVALRVWAIGYGVGCLAMLPLIYYNYKRWRQLRSNQLPQVSPSSEVVGGHQRVEKFFKWLQRLLEGFFVFWIGFGIGIIDMQWTSRPALNGLCFYIFIFTCFFWVLPWTTYTVMQLRAFLNRPRGANQNVILALPTFKFQTCEKIDQAHNKNVNNIRNSIRGDKTQVAKALTADEVVVECCICLDPYEDGVELKELPCMHYFHIHCIDRWLKINGSCPICKRKVQK